MSLSWRTEEEEWQLCLMAVSDGAQHEGQLSRGRKSVTAVNRHSPLSEETTTVVVAVVLNYGVCS